ncbi:MAG: thioesterase family protein [Solirubrobacteraceae bacterium]
MTLESVFVHDGDRFNATALALGPWAPGALHGGAAAALIVDALERAPVAAGLRLARLTCELVRPVPMHGLMVSVQVVRPGRRVTLLDAFLRDSDDVEVCRGRALLLAPAELDGPADCEAPPFPGPAAGRASDWRPPSSGPTFAADAMEILFVEGDFEEIGPATAWFRLRQPLIAGAQLTPLQRVAAAADFGNGIASALSWGEHMFINPDLTVHFEREPIGQWVALQASSRVQRGSAALAESVLWDERGRIGRAVQSLLVGRR